MWSNVGISWGLCKEYRSPVVRDRLGLRFVMPQGSGKYGNFAPGKGDEIKNESGIRSILAEGGHREVTCICSQ